MTDPTPDRDLIAGARARAGDDWGLSDQLLRELADRLEAANREMHARELHHFEEERISHELSARIGAAIVAVQSGEHEADIVGALRGEKRYEHNTLVLTDVAKERDILAARLERVKAGIREAIESLEENEDPDTVVIAMLTAILTGKEA